MRLQDSRLGEIPGGGGGGPCDPQAKVHRGRDTHP